MSARARRWTVALLVVDLALVARVTLWPEPAPEEAFGVVRAVVAWLAGHGVPVTYGGVEAVANVVMFVPFGVLTGLLLGGRRWWWSVAFAAVLSTGIELAQRAFLPSRVPTVQDVVLNTLGAAVGVACLVLVDRARSRRAVPAATSVP